MAAPKDSYRASRSATSGGLSDARLTVDEITSLIYYDLAAGPHTRGPCSACGDFNIGARGGGNKCRKCLTSDLGDLVGHKEAQEFTASAIECKRLESEMLECATGDAIGSEEMVINFRRSVVRNTKLLCGLDKHLKRKRRSHPCNK